MAKQTIFGRIAQLAKANINALLDAAEDPQKMLDQMVRDYTNSIREAEAAVAQTIGNLRLLEKDHAEDLKEAQEWGAKALAASNKADELRTAGDTANADKFDNLAKVALGKQMQAEKAAQALEPQLASQTQVVNQLKDGLDELKYKRDELTSRQKTATAQSQVNDALKAFDVMDPTSEIYRFEEKVRREEARVIGQQELASSSLDAQFNTLEEMGRQNELDARLAELKAKQTPAIGGDTPTQTL